MKIINITSRSITVSLNSNSPYYYGREYQIKLNNQIIKKDDKNVITIFDLEPSTNYNLEIDNDALSFKTLNEELLLNVKDFNAIGDGISDDTVKIQTAIMCAPDNSTVYIPEGKYLVTSLFMKSNITLYISEKATLIASPNRMDYPVFKGLIGNYNFGVWEGSEVDNFASIINFINCKNSKIIGNGTIDGNALNGDWYQNHRVMNVAWRGHIIFSNRSNNIDIIGLNLKDSPSWTIHPYFSDHVDILNIKIKNKPSMPTTDGIDPDSSSFVRIMGCRFDLGDDCIAIKSGTINQAKKYNTPSHDILIENNLMLQGHGGVVFGSELSSGINNVTIKSSIFKGTDRGLRIKTRRGRGHIGIIDNVTFDNIIMENVKTPFVINMYYNMGPQDGHTEYVWTTKKLEFDDRTPVIGDFTFKNIKCSGVELAAGVFLGLPESKIGNITFENVDFSYNKDCEEDYPAMIEHNFKMKNAGIYAFNCANISLNNVNFNGNIGEVIKREDSE